MDFSSFRMALASHSSYPLWPPDIFWSILWKERILTADRENHTNISAVLLQAEAELDNRREGDEVVFAATDRERKNDIEISIQIQLNPWQKCQGAQSYCRQYCQNSHSHHNSPQHRSSFWVHLSY